MSETQSEHIKRFIKASQVKKGMYIMIKGHPCKVIEISVSKTGKHGHAKCMVTEQCKDGGKYQDFFNSVQDIEQVRCGDCDTSGEICSECGMEWF